MSTDLNSGADTGPAQAGIRPASSTGSYVEADGLRLHYLDYGTAGHPPMLCLHGGAAHAHWFDFVAPELSRDYHLLALDQRGHGDSAWALPPAYSYERFAADVAEVVEKLDLRDFVLVAHSMGGRIGVLYAATYPGRVARLIVIDSRPHVTVDRAAAIRDLGAQRGRSYATREEFIARYRLRPAATTAAPEIIRHLGHYGGRQFDDGSWRHKFDRNVHATRVPVDTLHSWNRISIPALLIKGERSENITPQVVAAVKARCPHIELAEVPNSYHHIMLDNPSGLVHVINAFLTKQSY